MVVVICDRRAQMSSNGTLGRFLINIAVFNGGPGPWTPLDPPRARIHFPIFKQQEMICMHVHHNVGLEPDFSKLKCLYITEAV